MEDKYINGSNANHNPELKINLSFQNPQTGNCDSSSNYRPEHRFTHKNPVELMNYF
jgi:hypothetical protein